MAILGDNQVRMANICCYVCHSINGVSKLHSQIIRDSVFHDYYLYKPEKFKNVTNGIAYRRWLLAVQPRPVQICWTRPSATGYRQDASQLKKLAEYKDDAALLEKLEQVKLKNKAGFADYLARTTGQKIDPALHL